MLLYCITERNWSCTISTPCAEKEENTKATIRSVGSSAEVPNTFVPIRVPTTMRSDTHTHTQTHRDTHARMCVPCAVEAPTIR